MKAITIRAPWSVAIRQGAKLVENRGRPVADKHFGTQVAIHTGATWDKVGAADPRVVNWWFGSSDHGPLEPADFGPYMRKVIAVATLVDCHDAEQPRPADATCCSPWGDRRYGEGVAYHLVFADVIILPNPVMARGSLALPWTLPDNVDAAVRSEMAFAAEVAW